VPEREITEPVDLCRGRRLNPAAIGYTRRPLHRTAVPGWGRTKRWEYWGLMTPTHMVGVTVSSLDYAGVEALYVLDRATHRETVHAGVVPLARRVELPEQTGRGRARARAGALAIEIDEEPGATRIRASAPGIELDAVAARTGRDSLGVVVPWSATRFQYTVKDVGRPLAGALVIDGVEHDLGAPGSFAVLDHGRGRWPYAMRWNWGCGHGAVDGRDVAVQVGGRWTDRTGSTENGLILDGVLHKESEDLRWEYDTGDWLAPWRITGSRVDLTFHPEHERAAAMNLGVVANETHQCFGTWAGWMTADGGERVVVDGVVGWAEEARNRW
jgi:hypothetical protein